MIRKQIYLTDDMNRLLQKIADEKGVPQAEVIREGLAQYLTASDDKKRQREELIQEMKNSPYSNIDWNREELYERSDRY